MTTLDKKIFSILAIWATIHLLASHINESKAQGLGFNGMSHRIEERTSYDVLAGKKVKFIDSLRVDFEMLVMPGRQFGYILRIKDKCNWNLSYESNDNIIMFRLNEEGRISHIKAELPRTELQNLHWYGVSLVFDIKNEILSLNIGDNKFAAKSALPQKMTPEIIFGKSDFLIDVPDFSIRKLRICGTGVRLSFPLNQIEGTKVMDSDNSVSGTVDNPHWLMNQSFKWNLECRLSSETIAGAAWNPVRKEFYYFNEYSIHVYSLLNNKLDKIVYSEKCPVKMKLGSSFVTPDGNHLIAYELYDEQSGAGDCSVASLNLDDWKWTPEGTDRLDMPMNHHSGFFHPYSNEYTVFGGFGDMLYNGRFFSLDTGKCTWQEQNSTGDKIAPRYFTATGTDDRFVYVFGGMGNECGEQVVGRRYFYDLYRIDPHNFKSERLWDLVWDEPNQVPVRSLVIDDGYFYALCYPEYLSNSRLRLHKFSLKDGTHEVLADTIPIISDKMRTNANLFLDKDLCKFFVPVLVFEDDIKSELRLYSLSYPALSQEEFDKLKRKSTSPVYFILGAVFFLIISACILWIALKRRKRSLEFKEFKSGCRHKMFVQTIRNNSIYLFGEFTVIDRNGNNISHRFTTQLQIILILMVQKGEKGISSRRLSSLLWPDKEEEKVKNSRGVAINNLRKALSDCDGILISFTEGHYKITFSDNAYCDYVSYNRALQEQDMETIMRIGSKGKYLSSMNDPIFDAYKEDVENRLIPLIEEEMDLSFRKSDLISTIEMSSILLKQDPLNEKAMGMYVKGLRHFKKYEDALICYADFCAEYKKVYGSDYGRQFNDI